MNSGNPVRRLLIVTYHFPPSAASGGFRILGFTRHLPKCGWNVSIVAPPSLPWEAVDPQLMEKVPSETEIYRTPYSTTGLTKPLRKFAPYACWLPRALKAGRQAIQEIRPDILMTSGPPHGIHLIGICLKRFHGVPWVADFRDPWIANSYDQAAGRGLRGALAARLERIVMAGADAVVANAPRAAELLATAYPAHIGKITAITNGYDAEDFAGLPGPAPPELADDAANLVHTGMIYAGRDPVPLLDVLSEINLKPGPRPVRLCLFGTRGNLALDADLRIRGLGDVVRIGGQIPYAQALAAMRRASVLLLLDTPGRRLGVPAKLYEYIGAGRPILALGERGGDLEWVLRESGRPHRIAAPSDRGAIRRALLELTDEDQGNASLPSADRQASRFTREALAKRLAIDLARCLGGATVPREENPGR